MPKWLGDCCGGPQGEAMIPEKPTRSETGDDTGLYTPEKRVWGDRELAYPPIAIVETLHCTRKRWASGEPPSPGE